MATEIIGKVSSSRFILTQTELLILKYLANGYNQADIARLRHCSRETIKDHCKHIYAKLDAANAAHAVAIGLRIGLIK